MSGESQGKLKLYYSKWNKESWKLVEGELPRSTNTIFHPSAPGIHTSKINYELDDDGLYASPTCNGLMCVNQLHKIVFCVTGGDLEAHAYGERELTIEGDDLKSDSRYVMLDSELDLLVLTTSTDIIFF